jgi:hypothetical protein
VFRLNRTLPGEPGGGGQAAGIQARIAAAGLAVLAAVVLAMTFAVSSLAADAARRDALRLGDEAAAKTAAEAEQTFLVDAAVVRGLQDTMLRLLASGVTDRDAYGESLRSALETNPGVFATWAEFLPDTISPDAPFAGAPMNDPNGSYTPYFFREDGVIMEAPRPI